MSARTYKVTLTKMEMDVAIDALEAALAGPYDEGDFCWTGTQANAAQRASDKFKRAIRDLDKE